MDLAALPRPTSASSSTSEQPPSEDRKRKRTCAKVSKACAACQRSKSRCDLVTSAGCHRCRVLTLTCSLATIPISEREGSDGSENGGNSDIGINRSSVLGVPVPFRQEQEREQIQELGRLEETVRKMDRRMEVMMQMMVSRSRSSDTRPDRPNILRPAARATGSISIAMGGAEHVAHGLQLDHKWAMVSPLDLGLAQDVELLDAMNRLRKHQKGLSHLLPTEPSDPLLMTALLKFAQSQSRMYSSLMEAQLTALDHCLIKSPFEAILGLLVLSSTPSVSLGSTVDPYNCIERAFILARKHGLEGIVEESRAHWANLRETWLAETRRKVGLWYGIVHRAAWIDFFTSPTLTQRYIQTPLSVLPPTASFDELLSPLYSESILLDLLRPIGQALFALKHASCYHTGLHDKLTEATKAFEFGLALWMTGEEQNSTPLLILTALIIKPFMYLRITTEAVTNMPSPLSPEPRLKYLFDLGHDIIQTSQQVVQYLTSFVGTSTPLDLSGLPAFLQTLLLLPYAAISQADKVDRTSPYHQDGVTTSSSADVDLVTYRQILVDMTPSAQSALRRIDGLTPHACWQEYRDLGSNPDDVPNFESWDALWVSGALAASSQFWFPPDAQWSTTTH